MFRDSAQPVNEYLYLPGPASGQSGCRVRSRRKLLQGNVGTRLSWAYRRSSALQALSFRGATSCGMAGAAGKPAIMASNATGSRPGRTAAAAASWKVTRTCWATPSLGLGAG